MFAVQIIFGFVLSLTIPMSTSATELPYGQQATNGFRNQAQVAYVKPPREFKALKPTTITVPNEVKQVLDELFTRNNTKALMVVRNSQIIYERYSFGVGKRNTPLGFSISKSLTALTVGRAICDGYINSINDPIKNIFQVYQEHHGASPQLKMFCKCQVARTRQILNIMAIKILNS